MEAVIGLPANLFYGTGIPAAILVLNRAKPASRRKKVLFIEASRAFREGSAQNYLREEDLFDSAGPFALYVEAKQYVTSPRAMLRKAARQIWDTWSELAGQHEVNEAFLVVFRRGGPLVTFDTAVRHGTRTLYPVLIDIAETTIRGSRAREQPVHISADDLLPKRAHTRELEA